MSKQRLKGYAILAVVFLLGSATGGGIVRALDARRVERALGRGDDGMERAKRRRLDALSRRLELDDAQRGKVAGILEAHAEKRRELMGDAFEKCGKPLAEHRAQVDAEIRAVLRPEQQKKFDGIVERRHHGRPFGGRRHGPPHGGRGR